MNTKHGFHHPTTSVEMIYSVASFEYFLPSQKTEMLSLKPTLFYRPRSPMCMFCCG